MADRPASGRLVALALAAIVLVPGCGDDEKPSTPTVQRDQLVRSAKAALARYNERKPAPRSYRGRGVRLRLSTRRRVNFSIRARCRLSPDR